VNHFVADLGNSRLKWARVVAPGRLAERIAIPLERSAWDEAWAQSDVLSRQPSAWAISSVNPPVAKKLAEFFQARQAGDLIWYEAAADVSVPKDVEGAEVGGADRALGVLAALRMTPPGTAGLVVSCGTAITVERVSKEGVWQGGAIAPGLGVMASALHLRTAQVPLLDTRQFDPQYAPPTWGRGTVSSLSAGIFWGTVGIVRELVARQTDELGGEPWVIWAGGDGSLLARYVSGEHARIQPDLVLLGLSHMAFAGANPEDT
jgi:type III pantothenate kinase